MGYILPWPAGLAWQANVGTLSLTNMQTFEFICLLGEILKFRIYRIMNPLLHCTACKHKQGKQTNNSPDFSVDCFIIILCRISIYNIPPTEKFVPYWSIWDDKVRDQCYCVLSHLVNTPYKQSQLLSKYVSLNPLKCTK